MEKPLQLAKSIFTIYPMICKELGYTNKEIVTKTFF